MKPITMSAPATLKAAKGKVKGRRIVIDAYSGGILRGISGYGLVVVNLDGLELPKSIPLNLDHANTVGAIAGSGSPVSDGKQLTIAGTLADSEAGRLVVELLESGTPLQASVEVEPRTITQLIAGESANINGRTIEADQDTSIIEKGILRAVAIVQQGADSTTAARLAASANKGKHTMKDFHDWLKDGGHDPSSLDDNQRDILHARYQRERKADMGADAYHAETLKNITAKWRSLTPEVRADDRLAAAFSMAVEGQLGVEDFDSECLKAYRRKSEHVVDGTIRGGNAYGSNGRETLAAAILCHIGAETIATKSFGERTVQAARDLRIRHAMDLVEASCRMNPAMTGLPTDRGEMIRASFGPSTYSLPSALGLAGEKLMAETYMQTPATWRTWAGKKSVTSFREHTAIRPYLSGGLVELPPGGEITHTTGAEEKYVFKADTYARMFSIDRRDLVNDDLGVFDEIFREIGRMAIRKIGDMLYGLLLSNPSGFFATGNNNYAEGTSTALDIASLGAAVSLLRKQVDAAGNPIALAPAVLLVPPELEAAGASILNSTTMSRDSTGDMLPEGNPWQGRMGLEVEPRLSTTGFHASVSGKAWYLLAGPATPCAVLAFLNGAEMPTVETLDAPANQLGRSMRGYLDFGVALSDKRAGVKMKGEN